MRKVLKIIGVTVAGLGLILLLWGLVEPYFIDVTAFEVEIPNLPGAWQNQRLAVIGDLQVGMWMDNTHTIRRIVDRIVEEQPSGVILLGDFIYHGGETAAGRIAEVTELIQPLSESGIPVYAVLGNHDYSVASTDPSEIDFERAENLRRSLQSLGIMVIQNSVLAIDPAGADQNNAENLYVVGVGPHQPGLDHVQLAFEELPAGAARLVVMHNPESFSKISANQAPLALAGHTHGGQIRIPFTPQWTWLTFVREDEIHTDGWIRDYGKPGNRLYVNRGFGFSKLPLRINCPPELTLITLISK